MPCRHCEYDLRGVPATPTGLVLCPECGNTNPPYVNRERDEATSREAAKQALMKPLVIAASGILLGGTVLAATGGVQYLIGGAIIYAVTVVVSYTVLCLCCLAWVGFSSPVGTMALHVAAIHAATGSLFILVNAISPFIAGLALTGALYVYLLSDLTEMDSGDAIIIMVLNMVLYLGTGMVIAAL